MRTRTGLVGAAFLAVGLGAASNATAQLQLKGSDTLDSVTRDAIAAAGVTAQLTYIAGGSGAGETAMINGSQHISPLTRELNNGVTDAVKCTATAQQLLIGLDGLSVVAANQTHGDGFRDTPSTADDCSDSISGGKTLTGIVKADGVTPCDANDGCTTPGQYTFVDWRDVLALLYGGRNHNAGAALNAASGAACTYSIDTTVVPPLEGGGPSGDALCPAGQVCYPNNKCGDPTLVGKRKSNLVNCDSPVRRALASSWASIFTDAGTPNACRTGTCTSLRHAFRRDDLASTSDTFLAFIGLTATPGYTKAFANNSPLIDRQATASPYCSAGERVLNKDDADYLDLDPIRRGVDATNTLNPPNRNGLEQINEFDGLAAGGTDTSCNALVGGQPKIPQDHGSVTQPGIWPDPNIPGSAALLQADLGSTGAAPGGVLRTTSTRTCLGLILPISIPGNYATAQQAFFADSTNTTVACDIVDPPASPTPGVSSFAFVIMDTQHASSLCPNGLPQPCLIPYKYDPTLAAPHHNFNCLSDQLNPNIPGGYADRRALNLHPIDSAGHYVRDNYLNPNIPATSLSAARQARVVSAYFRLHTTRTTTLNGSVPTLAAGTACQLLSDDPQIGCLVKANTCTIGYGGRVAADDITVTTANNFSLQLEGIPPSQVNVQNLVTLGTPVYPMARKLWLSSIVGFSSPLLTPGELALYQYESVPTQIDPIVQAHNFVALPASVTRLRACPAGP
jgi:hypothetical protein